MSTPRARLNKRASLKHPPQWLYEYLAGGAKTASGQTVNELTALNLSVVFACVRVIAETIGSLPWFVYRRAGDNGRHRDNQHELANLLHNQPNAEMTAMVFKETLVAHALLRGNGLAEIVRDDGERIVALYPITQRVTPAREGHRLVYKVEQDGDAQPRTLQPHQVFHLPNFSLDGVWGMSVVRVARESMGLTMAAEKMGASFFGNGTHMGGALTHPGQLKEKAQANLRASINAMHQGAENAGKFLILEEGMKFEKWGIPPDDAQFLETRQFQVEEICRWFRVPPHKVQHLLRSTFSNIEHQSIEFVADTVRPWLVRLEQEANRKLIRPSERAEVYTEHLVDALLRGDALSRSQALEVQFRNGVLLGDEWRAIENRNPLPDGMGQRPLVTVNSVPLDRLDAELDAKAEPSTPAEEMVRKHLQHLRETRGEAFARAESERLAKLLTENLDG